jgi:hypothetical protein
LIGGEKGDVVRKDGEAVLFEVAVGGIGFDEVDFAV